MSKSDLLEKYSEKRQKCLVVTRVMGYLRSVENFNLGKQAEFNERQFFTKAATCDSHAVK